MKKPPGKAIKKMESSDILEKAQSDAVYGNHPLFT